MSNFVSKKFILSGIMLLLIISSITIPIYLLLMNEDTNIMDNFTEIKIDRIDYKGDLKGNVTFLSAEYFKGEDIKFILELEVKYSNAFINSVQFNVNELSSSRTAKQSVNISKTFNPGIYYLNLTISPGFTEDGFVVLTNKNYVITDFTINYIQKQTTRQFSKKINYQIIGKLKPEFDQAKNIIWNNITVVNASVFTNKGSITINSTFNNATAFLGTIIQTTAYTRLYYNITGKEKSIVYFQIQKLFNASNSGYIPIGSIQGFHNFSIKISIKNHENLTITLSLVTRHMPILAVIASNYWDGKSSNGFTYRSPEYYLSQVNSRFENIFNISIIPIALINFQSNSGSDLLNLSEEAQKQVGKEYLLPNDSWTRATGTQEENAGADILIILTNKTMDHLGIVYGSAGSSFNMVVNARGSLFEGSYRLPSIYADNLIQHELSHIFGAPDRWTDTDNSSIMTKSKPDQVFIDFATRRYWLMRTNWLEEDIQIMVIQATLYVQN